MNVHRYATVGLACALLAAGAGCSPAAGLAPARRPAPPTAPVSPAANSASAASLPTVAATIPATTKRAVSTPASSDYIARVNAGIESPFEQGDPIPLTGDVQAEIRVTQGRGKFPRDLDVLLYRRTPDDTVDDAVIAVNGAMIDMEHASFRLRASPEGGGHYTLVMPTIMPGRWTIDITVKTGGKDVTTRLVVETFD